MPLLVETKPAVAIGGMEPGVANAARELIDGVALFAEPGGRQHTEHDDREQEKFGASQVRR